MLKKENERIDWIDCAKGISIYRNMPGIGRETLPAISAMRGHCGCWDNGAWKILHVY